MRPDGERKKKLIVAFHFQYANQAAWKCDSCRRGGLELKRRCGFIPAALETPGEFSAREVEAFVILEQEAQAEGSNGKQ